MKLYRIRLNFNGIDGTILTTSLLPYAAFAFFKLAETFMAAKDINVSGILEEIDEYDDLKTMNDETLRTKRLRNL